MSQPMSYRRSTLRAIAGVCVVVISSARCAPLQTAAIVEPGTSFTLAPGQAAAVNGTDVRLTFRQVREDSRCPVDVTCVWEGDAKIDVVISREGVADSTKLLSIRPPNNAAQAGSLRIRFVGLTPVPRQADGTVKRNYLAEFVAEML